MKLNEFVDRLENMGKTVLNEDLGRDDAYDILYDYFIKFPTSDLIDIMFSRGWLPEDTTEEDLQPMYDDGAVDDILYYIETAGELEEWAQEVLDDDEDYYFEESLTEARNPENEEVNAIIRKWANSHRNRISKHDQAVLDKYGISLEDMDGEYHKKELSGPGRSKGSFGSYPQVLSKAEVKGYHPDADFAGILSNDRDPNEEELDFPDFKHGDHRMTDADKSHTLTSGKTKKGAKVRMPTKSQMDALQPYRREKDALKKAKKDYEDEKRHIRKKVEWEKWKRNNRSLDESTNGSKSLYDFYKLWEEWNINNEVGIIYCDANNYNIVGDDEDEFDYIEENMQTIIYHEADILDGELRIYISNYGE